MSVLRSYSLPATRQRFPRRTLFLMLDALRFVQRGVARREIVPGLTHFRIVDGRCTGFNGLVSLSSPVEIGFNVAPQAGHFIKALDACEDTIQLVMDGGNLLVRSGRFRTAVPCIPVESVPPTFPEGALVYPHDSILSAFKALRPFIGYDASRPWATGILLSGQSAYATNNIIVSEYWLGTPFGSVINVPAYLVEEVTRVNEPVTSLQIAGGSITFHYGDGKWIKGQLLALDWPDILGVLNASMLGAAFTPVPLGLKDACATLVKFCDKADARLFLHGTDVRTRLQGAIDGGALIELPGLPEHGCYNGQFLIECLTVATTIDLLRYPNPVPFLGDKLRGAICGMRED